MKDKKFLTVAKFEFMEMIKKPSFWLTTLFLPLLIGVIAFISGYSSEEAIKKVEELNSQFTEVLVVDDSNILDQSKITTPFTSTNDKDASLEKIKISDSTALFYFPEDFATNQTYEIYYKESESLLAGANLQGIGSALIKQNALGQVDNPNVQLLLSINPKTEIRSYGEDGTFSESELEQYIIPAASLILFFLSVFVSSSFMLQSVSTEKENRMIETVLAIIDKRSLMIGKLIGLTGVVLVQLFLWVGLGAVAYLITISQIDFNIPIDLTNLDFSAVPLNLFLIFMGFLFFSAIMMGTGAAGTGSQDSKNLSTIFILMAIFPMYLMQIFITDPTSIIAKVLSYFPFTSYMVLLIRNSVGALSTTELITGIVLSILYVAIAIFIAIKMFELGCLMYNRRPTLKEAVSALKQK